VPRKKSFPLRIDPKLYEVLERWAADEFRSVNAHIEFLLREAARRAKRLPTVTEDSTGNEKPEYANGPMFNTTWDNLAIKGTLFSCLL